MHKCAEKNTLWPKIHYDLKSGMLVWEDERQFLVDFFFFLNMEGGAEEGNGSRKLNYSGTFLDVLIISKV